ncbi:conserved hypothetical protein [Treponema primitia ZAS-2]|uniref:AmmeMemoRadiSam system protein B n=1 Tax=Treponema primitia (strain ATCC BAA-887 / DSM 12427 / ZAS-2) TaxID=545694 RepID=F5YGV6_TREPZ|nr:AmmeMemoRadiSam system protein B [Treponema primitia]AEF84946.1 conserved hypothetical protein [Treponema primitia ZAS-2]
MGALQKTINEKGRHPVVAGLFYPEEKIDLESQLCSLGLESGVGGKAAAIIAPHGAWNLSGAPAAAAFSAAAGRAWQRNGGEGISRVVILGTIHNKEDQGIFFSDSQFFETPLGRMWIDSEVSETLASCSTLFETNDIPHLKETSVEVLLPLVQFCFPGAAIVPVLMGGAQPRLVSALARALQVSLEPILNDTLLVISSNISLQDDEPGARSAAESCIRLLEEKKTAEFISGVQDGRISSCGGPLIAALLESGLVADRKVRLVSNPLLTAKGDWGHYTCYAGIAFE